MKTGKTGIIVATALIAGVIAGATISSAPAFAQAPAPAAGSEPSSDQKLAQIKDCISHFKTARAGWSQEPTTQQDYTVKIKHLRRLQVDLQNGKDVPQATIDKVCKSPGSAPY
jgi:hypothetical protein